MIESSGALHAPVRIQCVEGVGSRKVASRIAVERRNGVTLVLVPEACDSVPTGRLWR